MDYLDYIQSIEPPAILKDKTQVRVKEAIEKRNMIAKKRNTFLSAAACFILIVGIVSALKNDKLQPNKLTSDVGSVQTSAEMSSEQEHFYVKLEDNSHSKQGAQKIILNGKIYLQYCDKSKKAGWGDDNGNIILNKSDFGNPVCTLRGENLYDWTESGMLMDDNSAKENRFLNAKVYEYTKVKSNTVYIVQTADEYYLFTLSGYVKKQSFSDIMDTCTASDSSKIKSIQIWQDEVYEFKYRVQDEYIKGNDLRPICVGEITDSTKIEALINVFKKPAENITNEELRAGGYVDLTNSMEPMCDRGEYNLVIKFKDNTELNMYINKAYFVTGLEFMDDYGNYMWDNESYNIVKGILDCFIQ